VTSLQTFGILFMFLATWSMILINMNLLAQDYSDRAKMRVALFALSAWVCVIVGFILMLAEIGE